MVRSCTRSRGCKECRQRKVKCDENLPACSQCVSRGHKCPGPITGPVFVSMNRKAKNQVVAKRDRVDRRQEPNIPSNNAMNILSSNISDVTNIDPSTVPQLARSHNQLRLPSSYQPSRAAPFQELFLGHFISTFNNRNLQRTSMESWYEELPHILNTSQYRTVIDSIRAVTMVHYGVMTANMPVQTEAYRWYAKALEGQRIVVQKDWQRLSSRMPAGEEVLPPILFALFELVTLTTPTGFAEHIVAAAALLQLRKPENCQNGLAHLLFRTVRISLVYCSLYKEEQHIFATRPWTTIPFTVHPKTLLDRLVDILLLIPSSLSLYNRINGFQGPDMRENQTIRRNLESTASTQLQCLHGWWQEYTVGIAKQSRSGANVLHGVDRVGVPSTSEETYYRDTFTAACGALYHAGNIILYAMLSFTSSQPHSYNYEIESHAGHIISAASYLITNGTCSSGRLMIVFPLKTVSRWAVDDLQRQSALDLLREWGRENGISGICSQGQ